jgi:hypothetical protein
MAYTILLTNSHRDGSSFLSVGNLYHRLVACTEKDGRFMIPPDPHGRGGRGQGTCIEEKYNGLPRNSPLPRFQIEMRGIRLAEAKPYCGNHPGECVVPLFGGPRKKPKARWLEWDDWVAFHALVNAFLDQEKVEADVWTKPQDAKGKFWIRRNNKPRTRFDWTETRNAYGQPLRVWNLGDKDDQYPCPITGGV